LQKAYQLENIKQIKTQTTLQESKYFSFADFLNGWYFRLVNNVLSNHNSTDFFSTAIIVNFVLIDSKFLPKKFSGARNISTSIDLPEINCGDQL